ncbi:hypothetical protein Scep_024642 [Stephania cephalantha]|uniref:Uncharacterized protein n=1 Tax=Stephania cephalantha TaxID=152367 RepID=A0AAP0EZV5_9MAGN
MAFPTVAFPSNGSLSRPLISPIFNPHLKNIWSSSHLKRWEQVQMRRGVGVNVIMLSIREISERVLDALVDALFQFSDQPYLPSQNNFAPVEEMGHPVRIVDVKGEIPADFPVGVYIRNGPNPLFGGLKSTTSIFGHTSNTWIEGEGMLHALYFTKDDQQQWIVSYNNKYVETETFKLEKKRNKPCFLPAIEGDSPAVLAALLFNKLRFGTVDKHISNTNVFYHSGKYYSIAENHIPQEIDIHTLETLDNWDIDGVWNRPFNSHPKKAPGTGELVVMGVDCVKPFFVLGVVSDDGKKLVHKVDLNFQRCTLCHEIGVTEKYNVIMDMALTINIERLLKGGPLIKYDKEDYTRIGVMPRYGDADSIKWFEVQPHCTFHIFNCFEDDDDEVVVRGCRALGSLIPGPDFGLNKLEWFSRGFKPIVSDKTILENNKDDGFLFGRAYEWRINMRSGETKERNLTGTTFFMDFPMSNEKFIGYKNKYGYTQVGDLSATSCCGKLKYGMLAKLYFEDLETRKLQYYYVGIFTAGRKLFYI